MQKKFKCNQKMASKNEYQKSIRNELLYETRRYIIMQNYYPGLFAK